MKSIVNNSGVISDKKYPKLMISTKTGQIILFSSEKVGITINDIVSYSAGKFGDNWISENFVDFQGTVTLSNE